MLFCGATLAKSPQDIPVLDFAKNPSFTTMTLSPSGKYISLIRPTDENSVLVILDTATLKPVSIMPRAPKEYLAAATWISEERLVLSRASRIWGQQEQPFLTGELSAVNADGSGNKYLFGFRGMQTTGTRIKLGEQRNASAQLVSSRLINEDEVLALGSTASDASEICRIDVHSARSACTRSLPGKNVGWVVTRGKDVVYAATYDIDDHIKLHYQNAPGAWKLISDSEQDRTLIPLGFSGQGDAIFAWHSADGEPYEVVKIDPVTGQTETMLTPKRAASTEVFYGPNDLVYAVGLGDGSGGVKPLRVGPELKLLRQVASKFPGENAVPISFSDDGSKALIRVQSDVAPERYYLWQQGVAELVLVGSTRGWLDPAQMAPVEVIEIKARDGKLLDGYLTMPRAVEQPPMLVIPHGGPHDVRDEWHFNEEVQLFASRGYAVLQVNFRGSGGYGRNFEESGYRQWGAAMQDDVTDATKQLVASGRIDPDRIAIYGASYGGYAALMGVAREPDLYRSAISYVGVTDLELMHTRGDVDTSRFGRAAVKRFIGDDQDELRARSPARLAAQIKVPVMLAHGERDQRVPVLHAVRMRDALKEPGNAPEWLVEALEGHGFFLTENRVQPYDAILAFLDKHLK